MKNPDVIIIGGGITGLSAAYELARTGRRVILLEAQDFGAMASTWTLGGVRQSGRDPAEMPLARAAVTRWSGLDEELGMATGYRQHGNLRLARTDAEVTIIRNLVDHQTALGLDLRFLPTNEDVRAIAPAIGPTVRAASFCPGDGHADPLQVIAAYAHAARRHGAILKSRTPVLRLLARGQRVCGVETAEGKLESERVIVAAGTHTPALLAPLGIQLPLRIMRVCVLQTVPASPAFKQVFGVANADCAGRQEIDGRFRITTGVETWEGNRDRWDEASLRPSLSDVANLIARAAPLLPQLQKIGLEKVWGGLIDLTPDALPVLDAPTTHDGLIIAAGFSGHGFGIGPVSGEILKAMALGEQPRFELMPFRLDRFGADQTTAPLTLHG